MLDLTVPNGTGGVLQVQPESNDLPVFNNIGFRLLLLLSVSSPPYLESCWTSYSLFQVNGALMYFRMLVG